MTIDFFVHPGYDFEYHKSRNKRNYEMYLDDLAFTIDKSELPILIGEDDIFRDKFSKGHILKDTSFWICEMPIDKGEVSPKSWENFTKLLNGKKNSEIRVHGAYFGECTEGFAVQLFAYLHFCEHWNDWMCYEVPSKREIKLRDECEINGDFKKSNIRYGSVLAGPKKKKIIKPRWLFPWGKRKEGNITYQLLDEKSRVYY